MGDVVAAAEFQFCSHARRQWTEPIVGRARDHGSGPRSEHRKARIGGYNAGEGVASSPRIFPNEFDLAALGRHCHFSDADLVDLLAMGRGLGVDTHSYHANRMVLAEGNAGGRLVKERVVADLSRLTLHGMGSASMTWWGTLAFMLIEGTGFALAIAVYLYLMSVATTWPIDAPRPDLLPGTIVTLLLLVSLLPNYLVARWAEQQELYKVQAGLIAMSILGTAPLIVRWFEFKALNVSWDSNAYGSIVWTLLGLHATHIITDLLDTIVLAALMFSRHGNNPRRFGDTQDNAMYWNFVVAAWLPIYFCIYWIPRL
jgi:heme/copper-type cytochrome/quinol oxidase subunit 3